ncbi:carbonic anhydrase [Rhodoligotrophos appendicifer]|uniref:carbonic anhydrase n=1 Tax=Rhodoligotrophos appendicifer TaxID=987056 RepID=UPI00117EF62E|nr:carbonic anhydrase [Rhodoligotrophos appendicifer]
MCNNCDHEGLRLGRRELLFGGAAALAASSVFLSRGAFAQTPANAISGEEALKRLVDGNARYVANTPNARDFSAGRAARVGSQYPFASIVSCADSRVAPEFAFDQQPGDLFVVRVAGNFVNDDGLASLEFGTLVLGAPLIMVLGHTNCGAIRSAISVVNDGTELPGHLPILMKSLTPAVDAAKKEGATDLMEATTVANVRLNVERLKTSDPVLAERVAQNKLTVVGGIYDLATGKVTVI